jgi:hypothetical protein
MVEEKKEGKEKIFVKWAAFLGKSIQEIQFPTIGM